MPLILWLALLPMGLLAQPTDSLPVPRALLRPPARLHYSAAARYYRRADAWVNAQGYTTAYYATAARVVSKQGVGMAGLDVLHLMMRGPTHRYLRSLAWAVLSYNDSVVRRLPTIAVQYDSLNVTLTAYLAVHEQYRVQRLMAHTPDSLRTRYLAQMNRAMRMGIWLKGKKHYLTEAQLLAGTPLDFGSLYHRLLIAGVLIRRLAEPGQGDEELQQWAQRNSLRFSPTENKP